MEEKVTKIDRKVQAVEARTCTGSTRASSSLSLSTIQAQALTEGDVADYTIYFVNSTKNVSDLGTFLTTRNIHAVLVEAKKESSSKNAIAQV